MHPEPHTCSPVSTAATPTLSLGGLDSEWLWAAQSPADLGGILVTAPRPVLGWMRVTVLPMWKLESVEETAREQILIP